MDSMTALIVVPTLIWAGVFAFMWSVDRRVRDLEKRMQERVRIEPPLPSVRNGNRNPR